MLRRAIRQVLRIFRQHEALSANNAKTLYELGLRPRSFLEGMMKMRDYKPYALDALRRTEIVVTTEDGRFYLNEEKLATTKLEKRNKSLY